MLVEILAILIICLAGSGITSALGFRGWALPALGFIAGICLIGLVGLLQILLHFPTNPIFTMSLLLVVAIVCWLISIRRSGYVPNLPDTAIVLACILVGVIYFRHSGLVKWHVDSFFYLESSSLLAHEHFDVAPIEQYEKRLLVIPYLHAPAAAAGDLYLRSVSPLISICLLTLLYFFFWEGLKKFHPKRTLVAVGIGGLILLLTTNRFIWHSFYLNGHLLFSALLLIIAGNSWLLLSGNRSFSARGLIGLQAIAAPTLAILRPEGALLGLFALLPSLVLSTQKKLRVIPLVTLGLVTFLWNVYILVQFRSTPDQVSTATTGLCILGGIMLVGAYGWQRVGPRKNQEWLLWLAEGLIWLCAAAFTLHDPGVFLRSGNALIQNVVFGAGSWGIGFLGIISLFILCLCFLVVPKRAALRFPVTTFLPLVIIGAYLRDGAYRVGDGDSLNRMLIQILPLIVLTMLVSAVGTWRTGYWSNLSWVIANLQRPKQKTYLILGTMARSIAHKTSWYRFGPRVSVALVGVAVATNIIQFVPIEQSLGAGDDGPNPSGSHLRALDVNSTRDDIELFTSLANVRNTHNLYASLRRLSPHADFIVPRTTPFAKGFGFEKGKEFLSGVAGFGRARSVAYKNYDHKIILGSLDTSQNVVASGEFWVQPGAPRAGAPGLRWSLLVHPGSQPKQIIVVDDEKKAERFLVDTSLLNPTVRSKVGL